MNHFDLRLTTQELDYIANLLAQQPWAQVNSLLTNIKGQVDQQQKLDQMRPPAYQDPDNAPQGLNGLQPVN